jgi:hypothetical protein
VAIETILLGTLGVGFLGFACCITMAAVGFRKLADHQHEHHHRIWISDGRPSGDTASRKEVGFWNLSSSFAGGSLFWRWYRETPDWAIGDIEAVALLSRLRRWATAAIGAWALAALSFIVLGFKLGMFSQG